MTIFRAQTIRYVLIAQLLAGFLFVHVSLWAQQSSPSEAVAELRSDIRSLQSQITRNDREIDVLRNVEAEARLRVVEDAVFEGKILGRTVAAAVLVQLMLSAMGHHSVRKMTRRPDESS